MKLFLILLITFSTNLLATLEENSSSDETLNKIEQKDSDSSIQGRKTTKIIDGIQKTTQINGVYDRSITDEEVVIFLDKLKQTVKSKNYEKLSTLINYKRPCLWHPACKKKCRNACAHKTPKSVPLENKRQFLKHAKSIFSQKFNNVILNTKSEHLFVNSQGFMIGRGEIWFDPREGIVAFNSGCAYWDR